MLNWAHLILETIQTVILTSIAIWTIIEVIPPALEILQRISQC